MNRSVVCRFCAGLSAIHLCAMLACADGAADKLAPPAADARAHEIKMVEEVYKDQIAKAHTLAEKSALASDLIQAAGQAKEKIAEQFAPRGHWGNGETLLNGGPKGEVHLPGKVEKADAWAFLKVRVAENKATFSYNGVEAGSCDLATPMTPASRVKVGFSSHGTQISIKDVYLVEK